VLEDAGRQAEEARAAERARGQIEHDRMLLEAEAALELEAASTRRDLAGRLETVVVAAAERVVGIEVDASRHRALLERAVSSLTRTEEASQS
jgi:F0F1-type ATP synthase membrane subunit b/b'